MTKALKPPVWRNATTEWHSRPYVWARVNGWKIDVREVLRGWEPTGLFYYFAKRGDDIYNSAWPEYERYYKTREAAQAAAVKGAREGWPFTKWAKS